MLICSDLLHKNSPLGYFGLKIPLISVLLWVLFCLSYKYVQKNKYKFKTLNFIELSTLKFYIIKWFFPDIAVGTAQMYMVFLLVRTRSLVLYRSWNRLTHIPPVPGSSHRLCNSSSVRVWRPKLPRTSLSRWVSIIYSILFTLVLFTEDSATLFVTSLCKF